MEYLGAVANEKASDIIKTNFPLNPIVNKEKEIILAIKILKFEELKPLVNLSK